MCRSFGAINDINHSITICVRNLDRRYLRFLWMQDLAARTAMALIPGQDATSAVHGDQATLRQEVNYPSESNLSREGP